MAISANKRRSSWFGPQFSINNLSLPSLGQITPSRRSTSKGPSLPTVKLPMPEPLFHESYLVSVEELSPTTPDPSLHTIWKSNYDSDYFGEPEETLEDLGLVLDDEECSIVATFISITYAGKPRVVDILPAPSPREDLPRRKAEVVARPPIVWRMPSYDESSARSSQSSYTMSDRTESFCSTSTSPSSISDECKTPELISCDPSTFPEPQIRPSTPSSRTKSLRRHSRNLSASFSKAFLNRLKDVEPVPAMFTAIPDVPVMPAHFLHPQQQTTTDKQSSRRVLPRPTTATLDPPGSKQDMYTSSQVSPQRPMPTLRRKKSLY